MEPLHTGQRGRLLAAGGGAGVSLRQQLRRVGSTPSSPSTARTSCTSGAHRAAVCSIRRAASSCGSRAAREAPEHEGAFAAVLDDPETRVNCRWFRGGWFDPLTMTWKTVREGAMPEAGPVSDGRPSAGGSLYLPFSLEPAEERTLRLLLAWYVPHSDLRTDSGRTVPAGEAGAEPGTQHFHQSVVRRPFREHRRGEPLLGRELRAPARRDPVLQRLLLRYDPATRGRRSRLRQSLDPQVSDGAASAGRATLGVGGLRRSRGVLPGVVHPRVELRSGPAPPVPAARAEPAPHRVRPEPGRSGASVLPRVAPDPAVRPRFSRRRRRSAGRRHEGLPGVAHQRRSRMARGPLAASEAEPGLRDRELGSRPARRRAGAPPQHLRHRVLGRGRHVHLHLPGRAPRRRGDGRRPRRRRGGLPPALREGPEPSGERALERRVLPSGDPVEGPACGVAAGSRVAEPRPRSRLLARGGPAAREGGAQVPVWNRLSLRRRAGRLDGESLRDRRDPRPGEGPEPPAGGPPPQPGEGPVEPRQSAAIRLRLREARGDCCSAAGLEAESPLFPSSTATRSGPASSTRWRRI